MTAQTNAVKLTAQAAYPTRLKARANGKNTHREFVVYLTLKKPLVAA